MNALYKLILRGSAIGALSIVAVGAGCSDSDSNGNTPGAAGDDSGGSGGSGGSSSKAGSSSQAGEPGSGGGDTKPVGGAPGGGDGAGGDGAAGDNVGGETNAAGNSGLGLGEGGADFGSGTGTGTGPSVGKFCNTLELEGGIATTFILEIGEGAEKVTFTAETGECVPADGDQCLELPQGTDVPIALYDADDTSVALDEKFADIGAGEDWIVWNEVDGDAVLAVGRTIDKTVATCEEVVYSDIP